MSPREVQTLLVDPGEAGEDGVRLDRWFRRRWPHLTQVQIQRLARLSLLPLLTWRRDSQCRG